MRESIEIFGIEPDTAERLTDPLDSLSRRQLRLMHEQALAHEGVNPHLRVQRSDRILEDELQVSALRPGTLFNAGAKRFTGVNHFALRHRYEPQHRPNEARLART